MTSKAQATKEIVNKMDSIKIKNFGASKNIIKKIKKTTCRMEETRSKSCV